MKMNIIKRILARKCPKCGKGKIFKSYLKQNEKCQYCNFEIGKIKADDGPAWLTVILSGHIIAPLFAILPKYDLSEFEILAIIITILISLCLAILPIAKAAFIYAISRNIE